MFIQEVQWYCMVVSSDIRAGIFYKEYFKKESRVNN